MCQGFRQPETGDSYPAYERSPAATGLKPDRPHTRGATADGSTRRRTVDPIHGSPSLPRPARRSAPGPLPAAGPMPRRRPAGRRESPRLVLSGEGSAGRLGSRLQGLRRVVCNGACNEFPTVPKPPHFEGWNAVFGHGAPPLQGGGCAFESRIAQFACHDAIRTHIVFRTRASSAPWCDTRWHRPITGGHDLRESRSLTGLPATSNNPRGANYRYTTA